MNAAHSWPGWSVNVSRPPGEMSLVVVVRKGWVDVSWQGPVGVAQ